MADNFITNPGSGGVTFASDDVAGIQYPRSKVSWGEDGTATDVAATTPLPTSVNAVYPWLSRQHGHIYGKNVMKTTSKRLTQR